MFSRFNQVKSNYVGGEISKGVILTSSFLCAYLFKSVNSHTKWTWLSGYKIYKIFFPLWPINIDLCATLVHWFKVWAQERHGCVELSGEQKPAGLDSLREKKTGIN